MHKELYPEVELSAHAILLKLYSMSNLIISSEAQYNLSKKHNGGRKERIISKSYAKIYM